MKTGFLTFSQFHGRAEVGSSRIRARWVVEQWKENGPDMGDAELFKFGEKYDNLIFQKCYWPEYALAFSGKKILDLCDPDWMNWIYKVKEMIEEVHAITCSSVNLAEAVASFTDKPVICIPDRIDLTALPTPKEHIGEMKSVSWYGYSDNFPMVDSALSGIKKRGLKLYIISNKTYIPPAGMKGLDIVNLPWSTHWMTDIQKADAVINPRYEKGKWKYKSNNKTTQSYALGMPVAHVDTELDAWKGEQERKAEADKRLAEARSEYDVRKSVVEIKELLAEI